MKSMNNYSYHFQAKPKPRRLKFWIPIIAALGLASGGVADDHILFEETFETDGEGSRYVTEGTAAFEISEFLDNGIADSQQGPVYWTRVVDGAEKPSFVGVPAPTPEKRVILVWDSSIPADAVEEPFLVHFDGIVKWLTDNKEGATVLFSSLSGEGDQVLADRLEANGHSIVDDDTGAELPTEGIDMFIYSGGATSRFVNYAVPGILYAAGDLDDELLSSIGTAATLELPPVTINAPEHPAADGQTGEHTFVTGVNTFQVPGALLPPGVTILGAYINLVPAAVRTLEEADALIDGTEPSDKSTDSTSVADLVSESLPASQFAFFDWDYPVPGDPAGGGAAIRCIGQINIATAGTYSLALNVDDGARLRIDLDGNGIDIDDTVIRYDRQGAINPSPPYTAEFAAGTFDFEWVSFNTGGNFGSEILVALDAGAEPPAPSDADWDLLSTTSPFIKLDGSFTIETYIPTAPPQEVVNPFSVLLEGPEDGGSVFGGGPFTGFEGSYYAGSALNKFNGDDGLGTPKKIIWNDPISIPADAENPRLEFLATATFLDFETGDFLQFFIDDSDTPFVWFTAPSGNDKFFNDVNTNPANPTQLSLTAQLVSYPLEPGTTVNLRVESVTTWWNEIVGIDSIRIVTGGDVPIENVVSGITLGSGSVTVEGSGIGLISNTPGGEPTGELALPGELLTDQEAQFVRPKPE